MGGELVEILGRIADGIEKLSQEPEVEIEFGPPICPHCGALDPEIRLPAQDAISGRMSEIVVDGICGECGERFFTTIESFSTHRSISSVKEEFDARKAGSQ